MATTTIVDGNVYIASLHDIEGNLTPSNAGINDNTITHNTDDAIEIFSGRIEYNYINDIGGYGFKSRGQTETDKPRRIRDLKQIQKVITVTGILDDTSNLRAITKRNNLLTLGEFRRVLTLVWGTGNYRTVFFPTRDSNNKLINGVFILKMRFRETAGIYGVVVSGDAQPFTKHDIEIQFITGKE